MTLLSDPAQVNGSASPSPSLCTCVTLLSDEQLLEQFAAGQRDALDDLFRRYEQPAYRVAHRLLGNEADALDAIQEAFVKAIMKLDTFRGDSSFKTWLLTIVNNKAREFRRNRQRHDERSEPDPIDAEMYASCRRAAEERTPLRELVENEENENAKALQKTIRCILKSRAITREMRRVLWRLIQGWTFAQIAEELGCCEKTAWTIRMRLRTLVLRELAARNYSVR